MNKAVGGISEALASGDQQQLRDALMSNDVVALYTDTPNGKAPVILTDAEGRRAVATFSSQESLDAFAAGALVAVVPGSEVAALAMRQQVDVVLIDPAGPFPVSLPPVALRDLIDGIEHSDHTSVVKGDQDFAEPAETDVVGTLRGAIRTLAPAHLTYFIVDRVVGEHRVLTVAVGGDREEVHQAARALDGLVTADFDVMRVDGDALEVLERQAPQCRVNLER